MAARAVGVFPADRVRAVRSPQSPFFKGEIRPAERVDFFEDRRCLGVLYFVFIMLSLAPAVSAVMAIVLGALVAAHRSLRFQVIVGITIATGLLNGALNGLELSRAGSSSLLVLGVATSVFVALALLAGQAASLRALWARTVARVAGSWIAASGLFMPDWAMRAA